MYTLTITLGRNIGDEPMSDRQFELAIKAVKSGVEKIVSRDVDDLPVVEVHIGEGRWNGQGEQSAMVTFRRNGDWEAIEIIDVRQYLHLAAVMLEQEAIAMATGESHLIFSSTEAAGI